MTKPGSTEALPRPFRHERPPEPNNPHNEFCTSEITTLFGHAGAATQGGHAGVRPCLQFSERFDNLPCRFLLFL